MVPSPLMDEATPRLPNASYELFQLASPGCPAMHIQCSIPVLGISNENFVFMQ
jgi:hypothetical protein